MQTPSSLSSDLNPPSVESARLVIETALSERRKNLNEMESKALLAAFRIPIAQTVVARSATEAMVLAEELGLPVAMKIDSPSITHKADTGGVRLNLNGLAAVRSAYQEILEDVKRKRPDAIINGVAIEPMMIKPYGRELMVGAVPRPDLRAGDHLRRGRRPRRDPGRPRRRPAAAQQLPGAGSDQVHPRRDPPRRVPQHAARSTSEALEFVLLRISEMVCELPWIREMDINPLIVDENGAVAVDARITVDNIAPTADRYDHMAIHPYPSHLITKLSMPEGEITVRADQARGRRARDRVRAQAVARDQVPALHEHHARAAARDGRPPHPDRLRPARWPSSPPSTRTATRVEIGVCRYAVNPDGETCEFAIVVAEDWQHRGLARRPDGRAHRDRPQPRPAGHDRDLPVEQRPHAQVRQSLGFVLPTTRKTTPSSTACCRCRAEADGGLRASSLPHTNQGAPGIPGAPWRILEE